MSSVTIVLVMQDDGKRGDTSKRSTIRLPNIAPKDDQTSSGSSSRSRSGPQSTTTLTPRQRLPPRSRTGCWTCRQRKVKCDEGKPICGQCSRLGHACDYSHKLIFRNDTERVVDRMADGVSTSGCAVWDREHAHKPGDVSSAPSSVGSSVDDLPPFATLTNDEDRERKAEAAIPGTFNVIVNPGSFQHLREYSEFLDSKRDISGTIRRGSLATSIASSLGRDHVLDNISVTGDANLVILSKFEDLTRRPARDLRSPTSPVIEPHTIIKREDEEESPTRLNLQSPEAIALNHFRDTVWKQLIPPEHGSDSSITLLDQAASNFPPLVRAMVAVGSLAISQRHGGERLDSLQHYSETLPELQNSLKSEHDLASDGAYLTHFLMLVYEVATADTEHQNIWSQHIRTLLRITLLRRSIYRAEKFPFVVWWICNIDLDALLSGRGQGTFVGHMLTDDLVPPPEFHLYPLGLDSTSVIYSEEIGILPLVLQLNYQVVLSAAKMGLLAQEFRNEQALDTLDAQKRSTAVKLRQMRIYELQENLRDLWAMPAVQESLHTQPPLRARQLLQRAWTLYRACIIFSHTSMWPGQQVDTPPDFDLEIATAAAQILQITQSIVPGKCFNSRFLVFPLFMAGFASTDGHQKMLALQLLRVLEDGGIGRSLKTTRKALEIVYNRQNEQFMHTGHSMDVDWLQVMYEEGLTVVNFGL